MRLVGVGSGGAGFLLLLRKAVMAKTSILCAALEELENTTRVTYICSSALTLQPFKITDTKIHPYDLFISLMMATSLTAQRYRSLYRPQSREVIAKMTQCRVAERIIPYLETSNLGALWDFRPKYKTSN